MEWAADSVSTQVAVIAELVLKSNSRPCTDRSFEDPEIGINILTKTGCLLSQQLVAHRLCVENETASRVGCGHLYRGKLSRRYEQADIPFASRNEKYLILTATCFIASNFFMGTSIANPKSGLRRTLSFYPIPISKHAHTEDRRN